MFLEKSLRDKKLAELRLYTQLETSFILDKLLHCRVSPWNVAVHGEKI